MTDKGDWVLDPFMGVGTTLVAAVLRQRKAAGADLVDKYVYVATERVKLAVAGKLPIRPMDRPVYDPGELYKRRQDKIPVEQKTLFELLTYGQQG